MIHVHEHALQDELPPLEICQQLWEHSWNDGGHRWSSRVDSAEYGDDQIICAGSLLCDDVAIGSFDRRISITDSDDLIASYTIEHEHLSMLPDLRGHGLGREWLRRCAERYLAAGLDAIETDTGMDGLWTWPRMGFDLFAQDFCTWLGDPCEYKDSIYADEMRSIITDIVTRGCEQYVEEVSDAEHEQFVQAIESLRDRPEGPPRLPELMRHPDLDAKILRAYVYTLQVPLQAKSADIVKALSPALGMRPLSQSPEQAAAVYFERLDP